MNLGVSYKNNTGLTLFEVLVVIVAVCLLFTLFINTGPSRNSRRIAERIHCVNNLKQIGLAYKLWAGDNGGKFPMEVSVTNGGTMELSAADAVWRTFQVMSNDLSMPEFLFCPADEESPRYPTNFTTDLKGKISYFIGPDADTARTGTFLAGDDNFAVSGKPVESGWLSLTTNTPVAWSKARHRLVGNVGLADGSVQSATGSYLLNLLQQTGLPTNRLVIP